MFDNITIMPLTHFIYLTIGVAVTIWVAHTLRMHGRVFLARGCKGNDELASSLSHLLTTGFYLLHVGCLLLALKYGGTAHDATRRRSYQTWRAADHCPSGLRWTRNVRARGPVPPASARQES